MNFVSFTLTSDAKQILVLPMDSALPTNTPPIRYLFRFRDLVAKTIAEHQAIIQQHGSCWWGWWKRPSENSRLEVWDSLQAQIQTEPSGVPVGLFDSGTGLVHRAWVKQVIPPASDEPSTVPLDVSANEKDLVPPYYRNSPFSRAWMRIVKIEPQIPFFNNYSFVEAPRLPNYSESTLKRFAGKVIMEPGELSGMDTTIWVVRPAVSEDLRKEILLTTQALPDAVSAEVVRCDSDLILHLTDLHYAIGANRSQHVWKLESEKDTQRRTLVEAIKSAIGERKIGLIIVSGDLSFIGDEAEFKEAAAALQRLLGIFDLSTDHLIVIPGNHDIRWTTNATYNENAEVNQAPEAARKNYADFYYTLFRHDADPLLAMGRRYVLPSGLVLEVAGLNSSSLETGHSFLAGVGRVNEAAFETVANKLRWNDSTSRALRMLVLHHHLALTEDLEPVAGYLGGFGLALDAVRIQRMAAKRGVQLALHGHKHRAFLWRSHVFELPELTKPSHYLGEISIVGGGSAGSSDTDAHSNYFNLLEFTAKRLNLTIYQSRNRGIFEPMQNWRAALNTSEATGQLQLGLWELTEK